MTAEMNWERVRSGSRTGRRTRTIGGMSPDFDSGPGLTPGGSPPRHFLVRLEHAGRPPESSHGHAELASGGVQRQHQPLVGARHRRTRLVLADLVGKRIVGHVLILSTSRRTLGYSGLEPSGRAVWSCRNRASVPRAEPGRFDHAMSLL